MHDILFIPIIKFQIYKSSHPLFYSLALQILSSQSPCVPYASSRSHTHPQHYPLPFPYYYAMMSNYTPAPFSEMSKICKKTPGLSARSSYSPHVLPLLLLLLILRLLLRSLLLLLPPPRLLILLIYAASVASGASSRPTSRRSGSASPAVVVHTSRCGLH